MVKLLVEEGQVDVNAHQMEREKRDYKATENFIKGTTALHILAEGSFWWQVEAIRYLAEHGTFLSFHKPRIERKDANITPGA